VVYDYQAGYTAGNSSGHFLHDQMGNQTVYNSGNLIDSNKDGGLNGSALGVGGGATASTTPWSTLIPAGSAYATVTAKAGALPRDQVDTLVVNDVKSLGKAGDLWAHQSATGLSNSGYGTIAGGRGFDRGRRPHRLHQHREVR
jgi:hypothetical protein